MLLARALAGSVFTLAILVMAARSETPARGSAEDLVRKILIGIESRDQSALEKLTITEAEFKDYVWPSVASQASAPGMTREKYYLIYTNSSRIGLTATLKQFGGQRLELVKVSLGPEQKTRNGRLLRNCDALVRDAQNQEKTIRLAGVVLDRAGSLKVATFYSAPAAAVNSR